jgi:hypothetical protein
MSSLDVLHREIKSHLDRWSILYDSKQMDSIIELVIGGCSAFQLIYSDFNSTVFSKEKYLCLAEVKPLDRGKIKKRYDTITQSLIFSYDDGVRYQWFEKETLLIDISLIRDLKIENILGI